MPLTIDDAERGIADFLELGLTRAEATLRYVNALPGAGPEITAEDIEAYEATQSKANGGGAGPHHHADPPLRAPMRWEALSGRLPPARTWFVSHWLGSGPTLFAGPGGAGKTLVAQSIGTALALGKSFIDVVEAPQRVLYWACEDDHDEIWRRQLAICAHFGLTLPELEDRFILEPRLGRENSLSVQSFGAHVWTPLYGELKAQANDYAADILFLDNIGQIFGGSENDRHHVTEFVNGLVGLVTGRPFAVVILGHPSKAAGAEYSGSTAWENAVRMRWYLGASLPDQPPDETRAAEDGVRYLAKRKTNYSIRDFRKLIWQDGLYVPEAPLGEIAASFTTGMRESGSERAMIHALKIFMTTGIRTTAGHRSPDYLPRQMIESKLAVDYTMRELGAALMRLRLAAKIIEAPFGAYGNRSPKMGLSLAPTTTPHAASTEALPPVPF